MSKGMLKRIQITKDAIMKVRTQDTNRYQQILFRKDGTSAAFDEDGTKQEYPLMAYGAMGLLRFVETGDIDQIHDQRLKHEVMDQYGRT